MNHDQKWLRVHSRFVAVAGVAEILEVRERRKLLNSIWWPRNDEKVGNWSKLKKNQIINACTFFSFLPFSILKNRQNISFLISSFLLNFTM